MRDLVKIGFGVMMFLAVATGSASASCSNGNLDGAYGFAVRGFGDPSLTPFAEVGLFTADGAGNLSSGSATGSSDGAIGTVTFTGTYSISADCTGTITTTDSSSNTRHYFVVLSGPKKQALDIVETDPALTASGDAHEQGVGVCGLTGKTATFAAHLTGVAGTTPEVVLGRVGTDGNGNIKFGSAVLDLGGASSQPSHVSGTYTANTNCTGTAQISFGGAIYNFNYVAYDAGKGYLVIETDANTTVAGTFARQ